MLKRLIVAIISAQLIIVPAQAEQQKPQCTQGDMVTTFLTIYFIVSIVTGIAGAIKKIKAEQDIENQKAKSEQTPVCKI